MRFVPGMPEEAGGRVVAVAVHEDDLLRDVVAERGLGEEPGILREERRGHVETVEPHLMRITFLVPESALAGARVGGHLGAQGLDGRGVGRIFFAPGEGGEQHLARREVVDVVVLGLVALDGSVGVDVRRHGPGAELRVSVVAGALPQLNQRQGEHARRIIPAGLALAALERGAQALHFGIRQALRPFERGGTVEFGDFRRNAPGAGNRQDQSGKQNGPSRNKDPRGKLRGIGSIANEAGKVFHGADVGGLGIAN